jgi:hypothetical protein
MPSIDAPGSSGAPGETLSDIWVSLTLVEAVELLAGVRAVARLPLKGSAILLGAPRGQSDDQSSLRSAATRSE